MARRPIAVIDSETDPFAPGRFVKPFIWGFYDGTEYRQFDETGDLIEFLSDKRIIVYAHNGGKFDYHFMLDYLEPFSEIQIINSRLSKFRIGECEFRDSLNILPVGLKQFAKDDFDYALMEPDVRDLPENRKKIEEYLRHDCEYLYKLVTRFIGEYGLQLTTASAALGQWKKITKRKPPKTDQAFYDEFVPFYYGGRVECFQSGVIEKAFAVYDINSAYPYAMLHRHAFGADYLTGCDKREIAPQDFYVVECRAKGAFPFHAADKRLQFPRDSDIRTYHVTGWELLAALETDSIEDWRIIEWRHFPETTDFTEYVEKFWLLRKQAKAEGDKAADIYAKLFLNGLYGKFSANPERYRRYLILDSDEYGLDEELDMDDETFHVAGNLGPWRIAERKLNEDERRYYNVATGASITGFVRAYLWRAIHSCGLEHVLYCDTDSIATCRRGDFLVPGAELGRWKHEGDFERAGIAGKKLYIFEGDSVKKAHKGARLTNAELWKLARGEKVVYKSEVPTYSPKSAPRFVNRELRLTA